MAGSKIEPTEGETPAAAEPDVPVKPDADSKPAEPEAEADKVEETEVSEDDDEKETKKKDDDASTASPPKRTKSPKPSSPAPVTPSRKTSQAGSVAASPSSERTNIRQRLEVVVKSTPVTANRSADLVPLTQQYEENRKNLKKLHAAAKAYQKGLHDLHDKRLELAKQLSIIADGTPLFDAIGKPDSQKVGDAEAEDEEPATLSFEARVRKLAAESEMQSKQFDMSFLDYVAEWDRVTSERIVSELKHATKLKSTRSHYEDKVGKLRKDNREQEEKGKSPKKSHVEKLERNEEKLRKAYEEHEEYCGHLCVLIEEASTKVGRWRDLLPLASDYMRWESNRCSSESQYIGHLGELIEEMEGAAKSADESSS